MKLGRYANNLIIIIIIIIGVLWGDKGEYYLSSVFCLRISFWLLSWRGAIKKIGVWVGKRGVCILKAGWTQSYPLSDSFVNGSNYYPWSILPPPPQFIPIMMMIHIHLCHHHCTLLYPGYTFRQVLPSLDIFCINTGHCYSGSKCKILL